VITRIWTNKLGQWAEVRCDRCGRIGLMPPTAAQPMTAGMPVGTESLCPDCLGS
jgi:hypothetical protein